MSEHSDAHAKTVAVPSGSDDSAALDPRVGTTISGRYKLLERIGRGGMGAVYRAEQLTTGKQVAVKTLLPGLGVVEEIARRFEREARASSLLNHPNVISVIDFGSLDDGGLFLVMEFLRGTSLGDLLDEGPIDPERGVRIMTQVLRALAYAHDRGVIHRDLKPDNIMVLEAGDFEEERDRVKLLDFGIAKVVGEAEAEVGGEKLTQAGIAFGTPDYMSPEQALGEPVDARCDVYAAGVILYEILTGKKPFENDDKMAVLRMQVAVPPPTLADKAPGVAFSPELEAVVARALGKKPDQRFSGAGEMLAALEAAVRAPLAGTLDSAPPVESTGPLGYAPLPTMSGSTTPVGAAPARIGRRVAFGVAAFVILGTLVAVFAAVNKGGRKPQVVPGIAGTPLVARAKKSELARRAEALLAEGQPSAAIDLVESATATSEGERDPYAHLVLGHARVVQGHNIEALAAYERAVALARELSQDERMRRNVAAMVDRRDKSLARAALYFLGNRVGDPAADVIVRVASSHQSRDLRQQAFLLADRLGVKHRIDLVSSYFLDLRQARNCDEKREVLSRIKGLKDKRALPELKKFRGRRGGFLGLSRPYECVKREIDDAIATLEALP